MRPAGSHKCSLAGIKYFINGAAVGGEDGPSCLPRATSLANGMELGSLRGAAIASSAFTIGRGAPGFHLQRELARAEVGGCDCFAVVRQFYVFLAIVRSLSTAGWRG